MEKIDALRQMEEAWIEASGHSEYIERLLREINDRLRPAPELHALLAEANRRYEDAMRRYKDASTSYYERATAEVA
jgi:hypothetical protein